jgi:thioredoxin 1
MKVLTPEEFREKLSSNEKFIVDLYADWCGPCRVLGPIVEKAAIKLEEENSEVKIYKFNIETDRELAMSLGVRSIPTIKAYKDGSEFMAHVGVVQESVILEMAKFIL